jgi:hypothetical protein
VWTVAWSSLAFLTLGFFPRLFILGFWVFSDLLGDAYDGWVLPAIGFAIAPSATVLYALMWAAGSDSVDGAEWLVVAFGLLLDLWMWRLLARALGR